MTFTSMLSENFLSQMNLKEYYNKSLKLDSEAHKQPERTLETA